MAISDRSYSGGNFSLDIAGYNVGYLKKFSGLSMEGDLVNNDVGPDNIVKKNIGNFKWSAAKATVGMGMGEGMYRWIKSSFDKSYFPNHGAVVSGDFNFKAQSRLDFEDALITEVAVPKLDASAKEAAYFDISWEAERVRWAKGGGEDIRYGKMGPKQKDWLTCNFRVEIAGLEEECKAVSTVDGFSWKCSVAPDFCGITNEPTKHPCKVSVPNIKLGISMKDYQRWAERVHSWFVQGNRSEAHDEMHGRIVFLKPNLKDELGEIALENVGFVSLKKDDMEANAEKVARFSVEMYVEKMTFKIMEYDA